MSLRLSHAVRPCLKRVSVVGDGAGEGSCETGLLS